MIRFDDDEGDGQDEVEAERTEPVKTKSEAELHRMATERQERSGGTYAQAYAAVLQANPQLYAQYTKELRAKIAAAEGRA